MREKELLLGRFKDGHTSFIELLDTNSLGYIETTDLRFVIDIATNTNIEYRKILNNVEKTLEFYSWVFIFFTIIISLKAILISIFLLISFPILYIFFYFLELSTKYQLKYAFQDLTKVYLSLSALEHCRLLEQDLYQLRQCLTWLGHSIDDTANLDYKLIKSWDYRNENANRR